MSTALQPVQMLSPGDNIESYISAVTSIPILSNEEEKELGFRLQDENDIEAARIMVMSHLRFVIHITRSYTGYGLNQSDLIQEGNVGLMKAVKRFNPEFGVKMVSFAVHWIKAEIHEFIIRNVRIVNIATTKSQRKMFFNLKKCKKTLSWFTESEIQDIAKDMNVEPKVIKQMEGRLYSADTQFDMDVSDSESTSFLSPDQFLIAKSINPEVAVEIEQTGKNTTMGLHKALQTLDERSYDILSKRWLMVKKSTLHDLSAEYGVSAERIRQLEKNAMNKVKLLMAA
jgi:RNA polymerase sigma-32 factor